MKDEALVSRLRSQLLDWYDAHGRDLPWREKGARRDGRDPYRVWLSEVMLQQTTVAHAAPYYDKFLRLWPTVNDLAAAEDGRVMAEWAGLGYYARARRLLACARVVARDFGGAFPADEAGLLALPGFGPYTAAAVAAIAFGQAANVIDGNIERVMTRLYAIDTPLPAGRMAVREAAAQWVTTDRPGDWPQALMDLAAGICRPKAPLCLLCPLQAGCDAFRRGDAERFPVKPARAAKPRRHGVAFLIMSGDGFIAERRPDKGLLGGMLGLPHSEWRAQPWRDGDIMPPVAGPFEDLGSYAHVFTHFALSQSVRLYRIADSDVQALLRLHNSWQFAPLADKAALPTVFRKAFALKP